MNNTSYKRFTEGEIAEKLYNLAKNKEKLLIIAHRNPDGDAVGSAFALKLIYEAMGGSAKCVFADPIPDYLRFLIKGQNDTEYKENEEFDCMITVDTASIQQMGELSHLADRVSFAIDHHAMGEQYCDALIDGEASAAGEIVYYIYSALVAEGVLENDAEVFRLIYAAISADTGSFRYSNTTYKTHIAVASFIELINEDKNGMSTSEIARLIHDSKSMANLKATKLCIEKMESRADGRITYAVIERADIENSGISDEDMGACIDIPRSVAGSLLSFVIKEAKDSEEGKRSFRISARSSCDISVAEICRKFGGGGHAKAAGGAVTAENAKEAEKAVLSEFLAALNEVK